MTALAPLTGRRGRCTAGVVALAVAVLVLSSTGPYLQEALAGETENFRLEPHPLRVDGEERRSFRYELPDGGSVRDGVLLTNKTDEVRRFRVYASDASRHPETGALSIAPYGADAQGLAQWMQVETEEVTLLPRTHEVVAFSVQRPSDSASSGRAAIVAEEVRDDAAGAGIEVLFRLAILVSLEGAEPSLEVAAPALSFPVAFVPHRAEAATTISNDSLEPVTAEVAWKVESITGRVWDLGSQQVLIAPGEELDLEREWSNVPRWGGFYQVGVDVTTTINTVTVRSDRVVALPLWLLALVIAAVGIRGLREMWSRRRELSWDAGSHEEVAPAPDLDALRRRLIEAALWLHGAGRDAPSEVRETTALEAEAIASRARHAPNGRDIERAARSLAAFARNQDDASARQAAGEFDAWFREHLDDPRVKEPVGS